MGRDDNGAPDLGEDDDGESHAADEPTAVWDENALRAAGLGDLWRKREAEPVAPATPPAVPPSAKDASIVIEDSIAEQPVAVMAKIAPQAPQPQSSGLGWGATISVAVALGAIAYALIRYLKG
ncbi:MAG: hypothetical protein JWN04_3391 [Myxococcaceae bacterium]|nr:hypothetical protein [Myxococcaceae bacterium]